jgi:uncharacterized protein YegJ (DUF2314 family)
MTRFGKVGLCFFLLAALGMIWGVVGLAVASGHPAAVFPAAILMAVGMGGALITALVWLGMLVWLARKGPGDQTVWAPEDDPRLVEAERVARERWPEFEASFREAERAAAVGVCDPAHTVKVRLSGPDHEGDDVSEQVWIDVRWISGSSLRGVLMNDPVDLVSPRRGDEVTAAVSEVRDWVIAARTHGLAPAVGGFGEGVIREIEAEREKE